MGMRSLFGLRPKADYRGLVQKGAIIIDVRTAAEYSIGHIKGSKNIPLQSLQGQLSGIKKDKPVITCCTSGMRSASAKNILKSQGFNEVYNGGGWSSLHRKLEHK